MKKEDTVFAQQECVKGFTVNPKAEARTEYLNGGWRERWSEGANAARSSARAA